MLKSHWEMVAISWAYVGFFKKYCLFVCLNITVSSAVEIVAYSIWGRGESEWGSLAQSSGFAFVLDFPDSIKTGLIGENLPFCLFVRTISAQLEWIHCRSWPVIFKCSILLTEDNFKGGSHENPLFFAHDSMCSESRIPTAPLVLRKKLCMCSVYGSLPMPNIQYKPIYPMSAQDSCQTHLHYNNPLQLWQPKK